MWNKTEKKGDVDTVTQCNKDGALSDESNEERERERLSERERGAVSTLPRQAAVLIHHLRVEGCNY